MKLLHDLFSEDSHADHVTELPISHENQNINVSFSLRLNAIVDVVS